MNAPDWVGRQQQQSIVHQLSDRKRIVSTNNNQTKYPKTKCSNKHLDWLTLKIRNEQIESKYTTHTQMFENCLLCILLFFVDILYFEHYVVNESYFHLVIGCISLVLSLLLVCAFQRKPIIIHSLKLLYIVVFAILFIKELSQHENKDGFEHDPQQKELHHKYTQKLYNFQYLLVMSCAIFHNSWIISAIIIYVANIFIYVNFSHGFFSLIQIVSYGFPFLFYYLLRREKGFFAASNAELINIFEQVLPLGLIIIKKNEIQSSQPTLFAQIVGKLCWRKDKQQNQQEAGQTKRDSIIMYCLKCLGKLISYPYRAYQKNKQSSDRTKRNSYDNGNLHQPPSQRQMLNNENKQNDDNIQEGGNLLTNLRKTPFTASGSTYTSSLPTLLSGTNFSISYCNQFFLNHFTFANTSPQTPLHQQQQQQSQLQPQQHQNQKGFTSPSQFNHTNNAGIPTGSNHPNFCISNSKNSNIFHAILKSLKRMNLVENPFSHQSPKTHQTQPNMNTQLNPILSQLNINFIKDDKQYPSTFKIPTQSQQDTPTINKHHQPQLGIQITNVNQVTSVNQNSPSKEDQQQNQLFSNINLQFKTQQITDSKINQNLNSNNTVILSSKNILSNEDADANRPLYSFKPFLNYYQQSKTISNSNNSNAVNINAQISTSNQNNMKSKFMNVNPCNQPSDQDFLNPTSNRNILFEPANNMEINQGDNQKHKNPSITVLDEAEKLDEKNGRQNIQTVFDYIKLRVSNPSIFQKRKKFLQQQQQQMQHMNTLDFQIMETNHHQYPNNHQYSKEGYDEIQQHDEIIDCYQIDDKSDMKKKITVQIRDGQWQGESVLFVLVNKSSIGEKILEDKLQEVETFKSSLLKTVSHDLKTPLNGMTIVLEDIIHYFKGKQKVYHTKVQKQNNQNQQNTQSLAFIQFNNNEGAGGQSALNCCSSSQNIPPVNGLQNTAVTTTMKNGGTSDAFNTLNTVSNPKSLKISALQLSNNYKEKKSQIIKHIENLNQIVYRTKILTSVIDDILDYSAIKINNFKLNTDQFDLRTFLLEIKELFQKNFEEKKLQLIIDCPFQDQSSIIVYNDPKRIKQVLINMMSNSLKFTQKGFCKISVNKSESSPEVLVVSVKDSGEGMDEDTKHKLFQLYENTDSDIHGVGLGLVICRNMIGYLGPSEEIQVESEIGKGSTFRFQIYIQNTIFMKSGLRNENQSEMFSIRDIQFQKNNLQVSGANLFSNQNQKINKESSNHSLRVTHSVQPQTNKSLFLHSPTFKKHKKKSNHNLTNSIHSFDNLPKKSLMSNNLQIITSIQDTIQKDIISTARNKGLKTQTDSPLEIVNDISHLQRDDVVSIVLNEDKNNPNDMNKNTYIPSQNLIPVHSEKSIHIKITEPDKFTNFNINSSDERKGESNNKQNFDQNFNTLRVESSQKQLFQYIKQHTNNLSSHLESINYDETPQSKQVGSNNFNQLNGFNDAFNRDNLVISPGKPIKIGVSTHLNGNNDFKQGFYSHSFDQSSLNKSSNFDPENNNNMNLTNPGESIDQEHQSIDQEQYIIPEFDHNTNNLQEHYMQIPNKKILIVDDQIFNQTILESLLKNIQGIELIDKAEHGIMALDKIKELYVKSNVTYDLILMDWNMPYMDGLKATQLIRQLTFLEDHPPYIIFVTASSSQEKDTILNAGANAFIEKPVNSQIFYEEYQRFLEYSSLY